MKKLIFISTFALSMFGAVILSKAFGPVSCGAENTNPCTIILKDGTRIVATGRATAQT